MPSEKVNGQRIPRRSNGRELHIKDSKDKSYSD